MTEEGPVVPNGVLAGIEDVVEGRTATVTRSTEHWICDVNRDAAGGRSTVS